MDYPPLGEEVFEDLYTGFYENPVNIVAQNACNKNDPLSPCMSQCRIRENQHIFTHKIETEGKPVTDLKSSNRCWIFAGLNIIRVPFMKKYDLDEFEFSQSHVFFWDKIEKCYFFLNSIVETARRNEPIDGRLMSCLLSDPASDDFGQWDMLVNLINKYGLMPKRNFPETFSSEETSRFNILLKAKLREFSIVLRKMVEDGKSNAEIQTKIDEQMVIVYRITGICLGIPPKKFTWEYLDKSKQYHSVGPITPKEFYETHIKPVFNVEDKVSLVSDPRPTVQYNQLYTIDCLSNMIGGRKLMRNNQPIELLAELCVKSIINGEPVCIHCDVFRRNSGELGLLDLKLHDFISVFGTDFFIPMTKAERMIYSDTHPVKHAMVLTAVSLDDNGKPMKWRVENSSGPHMGEQGYFLMTNDWFKEFVFEVVVDKSYVPKEVMEVFDQDPVVLPIWDAFGLS